MFVFSFCSQYRIRNQRENAWIQRSVKHDCSSYWNQTNSCGYNKHTSSRVSILSHGATGFWGKSVHYAMVGAISVFSRTQDQNWDQWKSGENPLAKRTMTELRSKELNILILYKRREETSLSTFQTGDQRLNLSRKKTAVVIFHQTIFASKHLKSKTGFCWKQNLRNSHCVILKMVWEKNDIKKSKMLESWRSVSKSPFTNLNISFSSGSVWIRHQHCHNIKQ